MRMSLLRHSDLRGCRPSDGLLASSVNRGEVSINGFELSGEMSLSYLTNSRGTSDTGWQDNFSVIFAFAYADGEDKGSDEPIDSIDPINGVVGLRYDAPSDVWSTELTATFASGKQAEDVASSTRHLSDGYVQLDLIGQRKFGASVVQRACSTSWTKSTFVGLIRQRLAQTRCSALRSQACTMVPISGLRYESMASRSDHNGRGSRAGACCLPGSCR